jgi:hypothetical protein
MKKIVMSFAALASLLSPVAVLAQVQGVPDTAYVDTWVTKLLDLGQKATTFFMIAATLFFIWTVIAYIREKDSKEAANKKSAMFRGIIGLFVIVAIWGIVRILAQTFGVTTGNNAGNTQVVACEYRKRVVQVFELALDNSRTMKHVTQSCQGVCGVRSTSFHAGID